jgi:hypothetical protein
MRFKTKVFVEERVYRRAAGAAPNEWEPVRLSKPVDAQINEWVDAEKVQIASASAPSITPSWLDKDMTTRSMVVAVTVVYDPNPDGRKSDEQPYTWPEFVPGPDGGHPPAPGADPGAAPFAGHD